MARKSARAALVLSQAQETVLKDLAGSRTAAAREVERAKPKDHGLAAELWGSVALSNFCQKMALILLNNFCWELLNATEPY